MEIDELLDNEVDRSERGDVSRWAARLGYTPAWNAVLAKLGLPPSPEA